jgi:hypothetical protein
MIVDAWEAFNNPVAVGLDASRFDQHISVGALQFEHGFYTACFPGDRELQRILAWQLENRGYGRTRDGGFLKYTVAGCRMSGDMNTACGNVIIMCALMWGFFRDQGVRARLVNDGDDCVVVVERKDAEKLLSTAVDWFHDFGFTMKVEGVYSQLEKVEFCQTFPVYDGQRYVMCRDPRLVLTKDLLVTRKLDQEGVEAMRQAIGRCGLALAGNLPVFREFYKLLYGDGSAGQVGLGTGMAYWSVGMEVRDEEPTVAARVSFYEAFRITPAQQVAMERYYSALRLEARTPRDVRREEIDIPELANIVGNSSN